ncbi:MAG: thioesterase family protein [Gemmatimonadetes bacterium]|nr:thioesterase family protein [Gemmatimonadota bacterium]
MIFERTLLAGWADMDFNSHMRNSAYLDKCSDVRMLFFEENGFPMAEFRRIGFGPVIKSDHLEYSREVQIMESLRVTLCCTGLAEDGSRFRLRNEIWRGDGQLAARVMSTGGWLDFGARKLIKPPEALRAAMRSLEPASDFEVLPSSIK